MARTAMNYPMDGKTARANLPARPKPYYQQIGEGKTLGYIRHATGPGTWVVRELEGGTYKRVKLGTADDLARADGQRGGILTYQQALREATHPAAAIPVGKLTVADALDRYFTTLAGSSKHADAYKAVADKHIVPTLGGYRVDRLTKSQIETWQVGLVRDDDGDDEAKRKSKDTANRVLTHLKAALNLAFADDANNIPSDRAWRRVKPFKQVSRPRQENFDAAQVRILIAKAATFDQHFADLLEAGYLTGARLGELANATVADFDAKAGVLRVNGKTGPRTISLTAECVTLLRRVSRGRLPATPLLPRADGERWQHTQNRPMQRALKLAKLSSTASFYALRHSHISRAIEAGMPLSLIAENCGTSLLMIQRNYAHVLAHTRQDVIQQTGPKLRRVK